MKIDKRKFIKIFVASFLISCAANALIHLGDWLNFKSQIIYLFYGILGLLSFPWIYLAKVINPVAISMIGKDPTAILTALIIALGFSTNVILAYYAFFVRKWKWTWKLEARIKLAKNLIMVIVVMTILTGIVIGYIIPHLGGHGPSFSWWDVPFIFIGGLVGCAFAYLSVLTSRFLDSEDTMTDLYVYLWCAVMILIGFTSLFAFMVAADGSDDTAIVFLAAAFIIPGITGFIVLFIKLAQRASAIV